MTCHFLLCLKHEEKKNIFLVDLNAVLPLLFVVRHLITPSISG